jgi:signal transduction histidine kinase/CheY-like chemotaxis protein/HPt (histidine-containing phosphotransfer) domain-containing protein
MILAVTLVSAAGYLTYRSLSEIVASVEVKSRPDLRLLMIRDIAADLDRAESSVRLYRITHDRDEIKPYYRIISGIDDKIDSLIVASKNDTAFLSQIDTISSLIEENLLVWNEMIDLYHSDSLEIYIHSLTARIAVGTLNKKKPGILKRVFSRKALKEEELRLKAEEQKALLSDLNKIQQQDSIKNAILLATESKLAITNDEIREHLYLLITRMENEVINSIKDNARAAHSMADETFRRLFAFAILGSLLVLTVLFVVIRYVIKIREVQIALEKSREETEKLARTREMFVANMSHEIRTPVNAIHGFAGQLLHEKLSERSRKMLDIIHTSSEHLARIVNDVLDFSRLQNNSIVLDRNHFVLQSVFEEIRMLFLPAAQMNNTTLFYTIGTNIPEVVYGDSYRLKQILLNLVGNAVKFTSEGEIRFSADARNFSGEIFELILTVQDNGIGIRKNMQDKVFDDFTQAEAGISRKFGGTGLGLSIVKKLVQLHQGEIHLESVEGEGTTIRCSLPYQRGQQKLIQKISEIIPVPQFVKKLKILVVDDEEYNRLLFRTIFNRWKVNCDEVSDGKQALEKITMLSYDIVFMDARMPGLSGLEASSVIRGKLGIDENRMPIIGTSATHSAEDVQIYLSAGMNAFLPKPFTEEMLLNIILSVIRKPEIDQQTEMAMVESDPAKNESGLHGGLHGVNLKNLYHIADNDVSFVKQMLNSFIQSTEQGLRGLEDSIKSGDLNAVHEIAHRISSPCRHVGADKLYSNLKMIEEQSKNQENIGILADLSKDSKSEFLKIKKGLQQHIEKL